MLFLNHVLVSANTKLLARLNINVEDSHRSELISLDNEGYLKKEGSFMEDFEISGDDENRLTLTVIYVADKDGYKAKYILVKKKYYKPQHLNPSTLKSTAG
ncbi:uncharacterized protein LOC119599589 [Lucilia sericata]|uniref:uncharacterized protein LOC119599589 n=1 Tax=Lucilia sericata TaxID=13632 RepID=UPI0018A81825|nr:uncharacterized protein LOC119599589 [Lucilia sericata]